MVEKERKPRQKGHATWPKVCGRLRIKLYVITHAIPKTIDSTPFFPFDRPRKKKQETDPGQKYVDRVVHIYILCPDM